MFRHQHGSTVIELLIAVVINSIIATAFLAVLLANFHANAKVSNVNETANAVRLLKERIGKDVREGRSFGDSYGALIGDPLDPTNPQVLVGSSSFPSTSDPIYSDNSYPPNGWPASPWPSQPYTLSNTCLIVQ